LFDQTKNLQIAAGTGRFVLPAGSAKILLDLIDLAREISGIFVIAGPCENFAVATFDLSLSIRQQFIECLAKLDRNGEWTGLLLAAAGLVRLGLDGRIGERLPAEVMLPAPGQGALAVTARAGDEQAIAAARNAVHHASTAVAVAAERAFLRRLEGGCQVPVAALAGPVPGGTGVLSLVTMPSRGLTCRSPALVSSPTKCPFAMS
jgi:hypothetical protein